MLARTVRGMGKGGTTQNSVQGQAAHSITDSDSAVPVQVLQHQIRETKKLHAARSEMPTPPSSRGAPTVAVCAHEIRDWPT
eukprot:8598535-Pyramimonas_sp.AAC.1